MRQTISFNNNWLFNKPGESAETVTLPHTWNALDGQDGGNDYWRGTATYSKRLAKPALKTGERCFIEFKGAAMTADVILNGKHLAHHEGGYSTFRADLTEALEDDNLLVVTVDNGVNDRVYPQKADFTFYGGLYRDVNLIIVPEQHFELLKDGTPGIKVTPIVDLDARRATVIVETWHNAASVAITVNGETKTVEREAEFVIENVHLWDGLNDPYLYIAMAKLPSGDEISAHFGCRAFHVDPDKGFFLNGRSYPLRGVSRHQDRIGKGNALSIEDHKEDISVVRELGANTLRLAHYQQAQEFYDLCDKNGLIVWAEIPYITEHMPNGRQNTLDQMRELITQCYNHPSIVCWGLSNEITASGAVTEDLLDNHRQLNELCHRMDKTRSTTMANVLMLEMESPILEIPDMSSYNLYFGWYLGEMKQTDSFFDDYHARYPDRIIGYSEYGADANLAYHAAKPEKGDYTEEYQALYHEHMVKCIAARPYLWATHVWNLFDFAADGRDEGGKNGQNQKGLVEFDHKTKKDAFYLYKAVWSKEPFVHLCGKRYVDRAESETQIKVYSNCDSVTLTVDGKEIETKAGKTVFTFTVPLSGEHEIKAGSGEHCESMTIRRVAESNKDYCFRKTPIVNWFDKEDYKPDHYSIKDTMGELKKNPRAAAILGKMMAKMIAARGDVAESANKNENLQKMMEGLSLESLIKQGGDAVPAEMVRQLNAALQQIKK